MENTVSIELSPEIHNIIEAAKLTTPVVKAWDDRTDDISVYETLMMLGLRHTAKEYGSKPLKAIINDYYEHKEEEFQRQAREEYRRETGKEPLA